MLYLDYKLILDIFFNRIFFVLTVLLINDEIYAQSCTLFAAPWTVACQGPLPIEFSGQEYWSGMPFPFPGDLPDPGTEPASLESSALAGSFFTISTTCVIMKYKFLKLRNKEVTSSLIVLHSAAKSKFCLFVEWYYFAV